MKTYEKIITVVCFVLLASAVAGWGLFLFTAGDRDINLKAYAELKELHQDAIERIGNLEDTIRNAESTLAEYKQSYRREYEAAISGAEELERGYKNLGTGIEKIENEIRRAEELLLYYFNNFGSVSSWNRVSDWEIFK